jgi:methylenetetrahydrofolate dehydrogenase (NADP+)/methenyltetrahydrofolate cyclohydrolase
MEATAKIIDGIANAARVRARVAEAVAGIRASGITPGLAVVLVGDDPASAVYVRAKRKAAAECGFESFEFTYAADLTQADLMATIDRLNADPAVHGILVQFPLPAHLSEPAVVAAIAREKDVDGFHVENQGLLAVGQPDLVPCTPLGCLMLLRETLGDMTGLDAVVIGRSFNVGLPMAQLLTREDCTVTVAHSRTRDLPAIVRRSDIVVAAVGRPRMVRGDWIKPGATVIDVGINRIIDGTREDGSDRVRLVGDVDFPAAAAVAGAITPVPGGVGPMTIACLLANTVTACCRAHGLPASEGLTA